MLFDFLKAALIGGAMVYLAAFYDNPESVSVVDVLTYWGAK